MNRLVNFYHEREHYLLGWGFILILMLAWEAIPRVAVLPRGLSLFFDAHPGHRGVLPTDR